MRDSGTSPRSPLFTAKKTALMVVGAIVGILVLITGVKSCVQIKAGQVGVVMNWGAVQNEVLQPGLHIVVPWMQTVHEMNTQLGSIEVSAAAASKDLQTVTTKISVQYSLNGSMAADALQNVGDLNRFDPTIVKPAVEESLKATTSQYTAEQLITQRDQVKQKVTEAIKAYIEHTLTEKGIKGALHIANVAITNFDFSQEFNHAIELKVKAEQEALQAENEKRKRITQAEAAAAEVKTEADAKAYQITQESMARASAIKREAEALANNPNLIQLRAVERWNGQVPTYSGGQQPIPFINVTSAQK